MSEIKNVVFRSAVGGYNKSDVNEYIARSSAELMEREAAADERVKRAENELGEYLKKFNDIKAELEYTKEEISKKDAEIIKISEEKHLLEDSIAMQAETDDSIHSGEIEITNADFNKQEAIISAQYEEIEVLKAEIEHLKAKECETEITKEKYDELVKKAALYDKTSATIGDTLLSANKTAEEILSAAREEARLLEEKAEKELAEKRKIIEETSKRAMESIFSKLSLAAAESRRDVTAVTSYTYGILERALEDIKSKTGNSEAKIKNYEDSIWRGVKEDLNSISTYRASGDSKKPQSEQMRRMRK